MGIEKQIPAELSLPQLASKRKRNHQALRTLLWQVVLLVGFLLLWEFASDRWIAGLLVSRPSAIAQMMWRWTTNGTYFNNIRVTLEAMLEGFILGAALGMAAGYITGSSRRLSDILSPFMTGLYTLPKLALAPLFLLWFGLGIQFRVVFSATLVFFFVYYNTYFGVREVSNELIAAVRVMGADRWQVAEKVIIPSALVWVAAGLKISLPYALVGVVVAEMVASDQGLGFLLATSANQFSAAGTFAAVFALLVIALVVDRLVGLITERALRWKSAGEFKQ
jgi:NitT/TauT family transport system permease protein